MFLNCMLLAVIGKYDGLKNPLRMLLLNLASVDLVATTLGKNQTFRCSLAPPRRNEWSHFVT